MRRAIALARRFDPSPNPRVGAVIVKDGRIVGEGAHAHFGGPHAEVVALKRAGRRAKGATLYVTLEPCAHWGKTPPCRDAIERAGIARVVAATFDRRTGLGPRSGPLAKEARALNPPVKRPYVIAKWAMTADGKIATRTGDSKWVSSPASRRRSYAERSRVQAILVGAQTVIAGDPILRGPKIRAILDGRLRVPSSARVMRPGTILYTCAKGSRPCEVVRAKRWTVGAVLRDLASRGVRAVLIEGGGEVHAQALGHADELLIIVAPKVVGGRGPTPVGGAGVAWMRQAKRFRITSVERVGGDVWIRGKP